MRLKFNKNKDALGNIFINHFPEHLVTAYWTVKFTCHVSLVACHETILMVHIFILLQSH
jgi:hypothetical protein